VAKKKSFFALFLFFRFIFLFSLFLFSLYFSFFALFFFFRISFFFPMIKRKQVSIEESSDEEQINVVPVQDFGYDKDIDESTSDSELKQEQKARWSKRYQRRNPRTGQIIGKPENPASKFVDLEAIHDNCSDSNLSSSEDESDGSLKEFVTSEQESDSSASEASDSSESSDSETASTDSFIELKKPVRMKKHVNSPVGKNSPKTQIMDTEVFDVSEIPRVKKHQSRDKMDDLMTIKEGQSIVTNGYAFPQSANLKHWYFKPQ
jgi:hypothetical protein